MNVKLKTTILLSSSLIIGLVIGLLISPLLRRNILEKRFKNFREPDRFIEKIYDIVNADESQKEKIKEILSAHHKRMLDFHAQIKIQMDSLQYDMKTVLTPKQMEKLERILKARPPFPGEPGRERGPFPGRPGNKKRPHYGDHPLPPPPPPPANE
jgi:hypothetical protein